ncbi:MAG: hypothetical protein RIQ93_896 [Verrucomicrobiota bacterium]|jgi:hypothetical protein
MNPLSSPLSRITAAFLFVSVVAGLSAADAPAGEKRSRWRIEAGPSLWFNTSIKYGATAGAGPSTAAKTDRIYDNGYNRVDASGNLGDGPGGLLASRTGYFGFTSDNQVDLRAGTLSLNQLQAAGDYSPVYRPALRPGFDAALRYSLANDNTRRDWGIEVGYNYTRFKQASTGAITANLSLLTDTYALGGVVPQRAPYSGRFSPLPGDQRIGDVPTRTTGPVLGSVNGSRSFQGRTSLIRVGPWLELLPATRRAPESESERWSVMARGGLAFLNTKASFQMEERLSGGGFVASAATTASASGRSSQVGYFLGARARRVVNERWAVLVWGDFLRGSEMTLASGNRYARFDATRSVVGGLALEFASRKKPAR